jgi:hypothetical protein
MNLIGDRTRLPGEEYRDYIIFVFAVLGGLIPETGSMSRVILVSAAVPSLLGGMIAVYYRLTPLSWKLFLAVILSCGSFFMRWFVTWFAVFFNFFNHSVYLGWGVRRVLFFSSLVGPCACLIPSHFMLLFFERKRMERNAKGR